MGLVWSLAQFAMDFMLVGVGQELVEQLVGSGEFGNAVGGQERDKAFLPVVVTAFDFAFGLWGGSVTELDAVEVQGRAELGKGVRVVSVEEGVVVHIEGQREAVRLKGAGEEVEVGQQGFSGVEACAGVEARGIVEDFQEDLFIRTARQPGVRRGVILPERPVITGLPTFDGFGRSFVTGVGSEFVFDGPAADTGAVGFKLEAAMEFAGDGTVGARWLGGEEFGGQRDGFGGPVRVMIATGASGRPRLGAALSTGEQVVGAQLVETAQADAEFERDGLWLEQTRASLGEEMSDQRCSAAVGQLRLKFFMARKVAGGWIFRFETDAGRRAGPAAQSRRTCRLSGFRRRSGCVPAEPYPPLKQRQLEQS